MTPTHTNEDFDEISWHDCHIHGLQLLTGDPAENDWTSDLRLDIDFIVEWICRPDGGASFHVAPADLVFHGVTDLSIEVDCGNVHQAALHPLALHRVERERARDQKVFLDRPYYRWTLRLNWPAGGSIAFGAWGFTQRLRALPVATDTQHLSSAQRE